MRRSRAQKAIGDLGRILDRSRRQRVKRTRRPRADVLIRRFLAGEDLSRICSWLRNDYSMGALDAMVFAESSIRRTFERADKKRGKKR